MKVKGMGFGEEFYGMSDREILIEMYGMINGIQESVDSKPCPSPECLSCRGKLANLDERMAIQEKWKVKREAELCKEDEFEGNKEQRNSWFWPTIVSTGLALLGFWLGMSAG